MKLIINEKEYTIKFGYEATVKNKILKRIAEVETQKDGFDVLDGIMLLLPELLLVGLQRFHSDEFGFDAYNEAEKEQRMEQVFSMLDDYFDKEDADIKELYQSLTKELEDNSFLSKLLKQEQSKAKNTNQKTVKK